MTFSSTVRRGVAIAASFTFATLVATAAASAADLPVYKKAPPPPEDPTSNIHGFFDVSFGGDYITPRGLHVTRTGLTSQIATGLVFDVYKNKTGPINDISVYAGIWNDLWSEQNHPTAGSWNEFDWWVGGKMQFYHNWFADLQYVEFLSPPGIFSAERNLSFTLTYDDTSWGFPVQLKPYVRGWYQLSGPSNVTTGKNGDSGYVEFGATPTLDLTKAGYGVIFTAPTWVSVGPKEYWNRGVTGCGLSILTPCATNSAGVVSTGLTATVPITWMPKGYGNWYVRGGFQYYHLINDSLLLGQVNTGVATSYADAKRDIVVGFGGFGFSF